jgi:competence protein ComEA
VAGFVSAALLLIAAFWVRQGGPRGGLVEIDHRQPQSVRFQVDLNTADWPELTVLPDIGETLARRIVESREREGPYRGADDLRRVKGIGPVTVENVRPYVRNDEGMPKE